MGSLIVLVVRSTINMIKSVLFTCLIAAASADADAAYLGYGYPYAYGYAAHVPFGSSTGLDPVTQGAVPYYGLGYAGYHLGKRSADAEPEADAAYLGYGYPFGKRSADAEPPADAAYFGYGY